MTHRHSTDSNDAITRPAVPQPHQCHCSPWLLNIAYRLGQHVVFPLFFGRVEIEGQEHLPLDGPAILAPTHKSRWDGIMVPYAAGRLVTGRDLRYMVSADEMKGFQGCLLSKLGGFPIDQKRPRLASFRHAIDLLNRGEMLVIFPEGGIYRDRHVHPLKPGLARLALQSHAMQASQPVKIVPMALSYSQPRPTWGCNLSIKIGQPLSTGQYQSDSIKQAAQQLTQDLEAALRQLWNFPSPRLPEAAWSEPIERSKLSAYH